MAQLDPPKLIGEIARESGVPVKTIRYYEELGLLQSVGRTEGGFRLFAADVCTRLHFIKRAQSFGLSLTQIKEFLEIYDRGNLPCDQVRHQLTDKIAEIEDKIQQLQMLKQELTILLAYPDSELPRSSDHICPILEHDAIGLAK